MGVGRVFCVALPFIMTIASLICILIVMTAGLTNKGIWMFEVSPKNLTVGVNQLESLANGKAIAPSSTLSSASSIESAIAGIAGNKNVSAADLGIGNSYQVYLWNYCYQTAAKNATVCSKSGYNWAASELNPAKLQANISATSIALTGQNITLPKDITDALHTYATVSRWTQIVYIIALILTGLELVVGLFAFCSRVGSCITCFISGFSTSVIIIASILATVASAIIVGALNRTVKQFGVTQSMGDSFLGVTWAAVGFSLGSGLFWMFSTCCCTGNHQRRNNIEKGPYVPIQVHNHQNIAPSYAPGAPGYGAPPQRVGGGYEPYRNV